MLIYRDTLIEALPLRERPGAIGLVLSLEGARYYVFVSRQSRDQVAKSATSAKIAMNEGILTHFDKNRPKQTGQQFRDKFDEVAPLARSLAAQRGVEVEGRHAEELMIEQFDACRDNFVALRGRPPAKAEVFLSHCPCQTKDRAPSPARRLGAEYYPQTCKAKLLQFCTTGSRASMSWKVYYQHDMGAQRLDINESVGNLVMCRQPAYIIT